MPASKETIAEELRNYFRRRGLRQCEVAEKVGISKSHASNLLSGRDKFGFITAHKFSDAFPDLNVGFLVNGEGQLTGGSFHSIGAVNHSHNVINGDSITSTRRLEDEIQRLNDEIGKMSEEKDRLLSIIETLSKK